MTKTKSVNVKVLAHLGSARVIVELADGTKAAIQQEAVAPGVPLEWLFPIGLELSGELDEEHNLFVPKLSATSKSELVDHYGLGTVTLGLVRSATRQSAEIAILPSQIFEMSKAEITGNPLDVISSYLDVGDVVAVRIYRDPQGRIRLRMDDIDDDEPIISALPILHGGSPWLEEGRNAQWNIKDPETAEVAIVQTDTREIPVAVAAPVRPTPGPGMRPGIPVEGQERTRAKTSTDDAFAAKHLGERVRQLQEENQRLRSERLQSDALAATYRNKLNEANQMLAALKLEMAEMRKAKRAQQSNRSTTFSRRERFDSDKEWFVEELRRAWIGRYSPQERRDAFPFLASKFDFSSEFFESVSLKKLDEEEVRKLVRVMVDLITGRNGVERKHTVHELFVSLGGRQKTRKDGASCWRVHLENGAPQAKRLHYWQRLDGVLEFGWVANHDDDL